MILVATILSLAGEILDPHITHEKPQNSYQLALAILMRIVVTVIRVGIGSGISLSDTLVTKS